MVGVDYPPGFPDPDVLASAEREDRIVLTNDRDFGELVVRSMLPHTGVIYLRLRRTSAEGKWERLNQVLTEYADSLTGFLVVTENQVRVREEDR